jgi:hypothetical protein
VPEPAARAAPPPLVREGVEDRLIDEFQAGLPDQLQPRSGFDRIRLCRAVAPLLEDGWSPEELVTAVVRVAPLPFAVISGVGLLEARLRTVARERPRAPAALAVVIPWCGECDELGRQRELDDGRWVRCPACHPGEVVPPAGGADPPF